MIIERACYQLTAEEVRHKLRGAPAWVTAPKSSKRSPGAATAHRRPVASDQGFSGWLVGAIAPGVSEPAFSPQDGLTLPEVFSPLAWAGMLEQIRRGTKPIGLRTRHSGALLACTSSGTLRLEVHPVLGGMFEAKLEAGPLERILLAEIGLGGIGCSVAFRAAELRYEQRDGREVRVVRSCEIEHFSLVRKTSGERALYYAARCFAVPSGKRDQLPKAWSDARTESWKAMKVSCG